MDRQLRSLSAVAAILILTVNDLYICKKAVPKVS